MSFRFFCEHDLEALAESFSCHVYNRAGEFSGVRRVTQPGTYPRLLSRRLTGDQWQMELFAAPGKSLWKRTVTIKN